jgi:hypothetical protein
MLDHPLERSFDFLADVILADEILADEILAEENI